MHFRQLVYNFQKSQCISSYYFRESHFKSLFNLLQLAIHGTIHNNNRANFRSTQNDKRTLLKMAIEHACEHTQNAPYKMMTFWHCTKWWHALFKMTIEQTFWHYTKWLYSTLHNDFRPTHTHKMHYTKLKKLPYKVTIEQIFQKISSSILLTHAGENSQKSALWFYK